MGSTRAGINMDAVKQMGQIVKRAAELTADTQGFACAKLVVFCNAVEDNPFMAGAFLGEGEGECVINVGVSGPGVVKCALEKVKGEDFGVVAETIKKTAFKITRMGQLVAQEASKRLWRKWDLKCVVLTVQQPHLHCLTMQLKKAVLWRQVMSADFRVHLSL